MRELLDDRKVEEQVQDNDGRSARLSEIRKELVPRIRRVCPDLPDDQFLVLIERMARTKLRDEEWHR